VAGVAMRGIAILVAPPAIGASTAHAASWSTPRAYDRASCHPVNACVLEPAPRPGGTIRTGEVG